MKNHLSSAHVQWAIAGFIFGTLGLFLLSAGSLMFQAVELASTPFMAPGRLAAEIATGGGDGSDAVVVCLMLFNGVFYAALFGILAYFFGKRKA